MITGEIRKNYLCLFFRFFSSSALVVTLLLVAVSLAFGLGARQKPMDTAETAEEVPPIEEAVQAEVPEAPTVAETAAVPERAAAPAVPAVSGDAPLRIKDTTRSGLPLPMVVLDNFTGSARCAMCHSLLEDKAGNNMSIADHWRSTMMANAAKDPLWQAKVASEVSRNPALKDVIEKKCVSCHMPLAYRQNQANEEKYRISGDAGIFLGFLDRVSILHQAAMDGVSCSLCHQIQDMDLGTRETFSGKFKIDTKTPAPDRKIYGPYKDTVPETMQVAVGFTPGYGPQTNDSSLCGSCHTLYTPYVDAQGEVKGEFPEQTIYLEWLHSGYGEKPGERHDIGETKNGVRICQECHMPHSEAGGVVIAKYAPPEVTPKDHFSQHHFVGGNVFMLNILQDHAEKQNITASTLKLEDTKQRTLGLLRHESAALSIVEADKSDDTVTAKVQVESRVGHKFPSGFPSRRAFIHLTVVDGAGSVVFDSGRPLADGGIAGNDADLDARAYEPHYDLIEQEDQVQIYESVMHDTDKKVTQTLLRGAGYIKDNRLLPPGFDKKTAPPDIAVYGKAADDKNFAGGSDQISYRVKVGNRKGPFSVRAELLYAPVSKAFMNDLRKDQDLKLVARFVRYYDRADKTPVMIAAAERVAQ